MTAYRKPILMIENVWQSDLLVVDLDNTLIDSDILIEACFIYIKKNPLNIFILFIWLFRGKAYLKNRLTSEILEEIDVETLPYNQEVINVVEQYRSAGKRVILASGTHEDILEKISNWLGLFDDYVGTNLTRNFIGNVKAEYLVSTYGKKNFDYVGDSFTDLKVWKFAANAFVASNSQRLRKSVGKVSTTVGLDTTKEPFFLVLVKAMRVHQWAKNLLILLPIITTLSFGSFEIIINAATGFILFSMCASAVYLTNDLFDLPSDRKHETKSFRPIPAGKLNLWLVPVLAFVLVITSVVVTFLVFEVDTFFILLFYLVLTSAYTFKLKNILLVDVFVLAILYTIRIVFGVTIVGVSVSFWLIAFSIFLFLSLALMKRSIEVVKKLSSSIGGKYDIPSVNATVPGRKYITSDLPFLVSLGVSTGSAAVVIFALYINDDFVKAKFSQHEFLWFACFLLMFWIYRAWFLAFRGNLQDDPIVFALKDKVSLGIGFIMIVLFVMASGYFI